MIQPKAIFVTLLLAWLCFGTLALVRGLFRGKARRRFLLTHSRVISLDRIVETNHTNDRVVLTDFGFGGEAWYLPDGGIQFKLPSSVQTLIDSGHLGVNP
jgi:hypothetical protein